MVDPLGGSYYLESLTTRLERAALEYIDRINRIGGAVAAIEQGFQVREIGEAAYRHQQAVDSGARTIVGVNKYVTDTPPLEGLLRVDAEAARHQIERLQRLRRERDDGQVRASLARLEEVAHSSDNTVPAILECVQSYCTLGEICQTFRKHVRRAEGDGGILGHTGRMAGVPEGVRTGAFL